MAAELIETAEAKLPNSDALKRAKRFAYLKLREKITTRIHSSSSSFRKNGRTDDTNQRGASEVLAVELRQWSRGDIGDSIYQQTADIGVVYNF